MRWNNGILVLAAWLLPVCGGDAVEPDSLLLDVFPASEVQLPAPTRGEAVLSSFYTPSGSLWTEGLDEAQVFHAELNHRQGPENSFALRVGKGGQIYSLRAAFGESVPPSSIKSPWNDEVWQFVAVCMKYNGPHSLLRRGSLPDETRERIEKLPYAQGYFIHNSGAYIPGDSTLQNLYCPLLGSAPTADGRALRTVNWGLVPQVRTIHRSPLLYYAQTRDVGDGVIELTWVVHNFSVRDDLVFDYMNAPWGGTRVTSLPFRYISSPEGELVSREHSSPRQHHISKFRDTGGWNLTCATEAPDSPSLALVFGRDKHLDEDMRAGKDPEERAQFKPSLYRVWRASGALYEEGQAWADWKTRPPNNFRNYDVVEVIPGLRLLPGRTLWCRSFMVVNRKDRAIELAKSLVDKVDYGLLTFEPEDTPMLPVFLRDGKVVAGGEPSEAPAFELYSRPVPGTMPVFLIEQAGTGREVLTTDPYVFVNQEKLDFGVPPEHPHHDYYSQAVGYSLEKHNSHWKRLLGFAYVDKPEGESFKQLSGLLEPSQFPAPDTHHLDLWVKVNGDEP